MWFRWSLLGDKQPGKCETSAQIPRNMAGLGGLDVTHILDGLNDAQRQAVTAPLGNALVVAGAGSGKTRVLVHRIAWLIEAEGVSPYGVLAVTFTNKAALEMRQRTEQLLNVSVRSLWVGTFHGIAHRLLRMHWQEAGLPQNFQILDADDQERLVKRVMRALGIDEKRWPPRQAVWFINQHKDEGRRVKDVPKSDDLHQATHRQIYESYETLCNQGGLVDFAELLLRCLECLRGDEDLLAHYRRRFQDILVDEFQDTNGIQYQWLKVLAGATGRIMAVGDEDQSIYGWRGARIENVRAFQKELADVAIIKLERNYRSTGNILDAANALISNNAGRLPKKLWTEDGPGLPLKVYSAYNDLDEAQFVAEQITGLVEDGGSVGDAAILYRSNAQSRVMEEALSRAGIPYRIYGGFRFFERAEIKNALCYMRLVQDRHVDLAFERVVNTPPRGIGEKTLGALRDLARSRSISLWQASKEAIHEGWLAGRAAAAVADFLKLIDDLAEGAEALALHELTDAIIEASGLRRHHGREPGERGLARRENLDELVSAARQFSGELVFPLQDADQAMVSELQEFLDQAMLDAGDRETSSGPAVQMMTLHSAKGLEFPAVFLTGLEEGLFPHHQSLQTPGRLEEERRLCYVGITRAMQQLCLTYAEARRLHGNEAYNRPSRFLAELPPELLFEVRLHGGLERPWRASNPTRALFAQDNGAGALNIGGRVRHGKFGEGVVLQSEGRGERTRVQVRFVGHGEKWLMLSVANLEALD